MDQPLMSTITRGDSTPVVTYLRSSVGKRENMYVPASGKYTSPYQPSTGETTLDR